MPGLHQRGVKGAHQIGHRPALRRRERRGPDIVHRRRSGEAGGKLDRAGRLPLCRILQVQIRPGDIGFPARRKRDLRPARGDRAGRGKTLAALQLAGHEIHAVGIDERDEAQPGIGEDLRRAPAEDHAALRKGLAQLLGKAQQEQRCDPFVGVVRGVIQNAVLSRAHRQRPQRPPHHAAPGRGGGEKGIARRQPPDAQRDERGADGDVRRHDGKRQRHDERRPDGQILRLIGAVGQLHGLGIRAVETGDGIKALAAADAVADKARVPGHQRAVGARAGHAVGGERARRLKAQQRLARPQPEDPVPRKRTEAGAVERQLQQLHGGAVVGKSQNSHQRSPFPEESYAKTGRKRTKRRQNL